MIKEKGKDHFFYLPSRWGELFGFGHIPEGCHRICVFLNPLEEEYLWAHPVIVATARELIRNQFGVIRWDYPGQGESEGDLQKLTLDDYLGSIRWVIQHVRKSYPDIPVGFFGFRVGAYFSCLASDSDIDCLISWQPPDRMENYFKDLFRSLISSQMVMYKKVLRNTSQMIVQMEQDGYLDFNGYPISYSFYKDVENLDFAELLQREGPQHIVILHDDLAKSKKGMDFMEKIRHRLGAGDIIIGNYEKFWQENPVYAPIKQEILNQLIQKMMEKSGIEKNH